MASSRFIILACDGGGVRGLITAKLLQSLDPRLLDRVDLFAGTSTGSIIALGLAAGVPIDRIAALYQSMSDCNTIFMPSLPLRQSALSLDRTRVAREAMARAAADASLGADIDWNKIFELVVRALGEMAMPKYDPDGLRSLLTKNLPAMTVAQLATQQRPKYTVVPSFMINGGAAGGSWRTALFHNLPDRSVTPELSSTTLIDAAMCSAAAPLFFPPHTLSAGAFVDGGTFANNPSSTAAAAYLASSLSGPDGPAPGSFAVVSIGTGNVSSSYPAADAAFPYGILGWLWPYQDANAPSFPLIQAMFAGTSQIDDLTTKMMLRGSTFIRVNPTFPQSWSLDDCSAIGQMTELTDAYLRSDDWHRKSEAINSLA